MIRVCHYQQPSRVCSADDNIALFPGGMVRVGYRLGKWISEYHRTTVFQCTDQYGLRLIVGE